MTEIKTDYFDPKSIALSGQCFRWRETEGGGFLVPAFGKLLTIRKVGDKIFELGCDSSEFDEIWRDYLDLSGDYGRAAKAVLSSDDDYLKGAFRIGEGIRILRQDLWETVVSFLISQNNNIPRIKKSIEALCADVLCRQGDQVVVCLYIGLQGILPERRRLDADLDRISLLHGTHHEPAYQILIFW